MNTAGTMIWSIGEFLYVYTMNFIESSQSSVFKVSERDRPKCLNLPRMGGEESLRELEI